MKFGQHLPLIISLICKEGHTWQVEYDKENKKLTGMEDFMKQHKVKHWSLLIFDYVGNSEFNVTIYKSCGTEADYRHVKPNQCRSSLGNECFKESAYIVGLDSVEREKSLALLHFNGFLDRSSYYKRLINEYELFKPKEDLILDRDMVDLYKNWKDGETINLIFWSKRWEIEVTKIGEWCKFGPSWVKFIEEATLELGDLLILRTRYKKNDVYVCTFKEEDMIYQGPSGDSED